MLQIIVYLFQFFLFSRVALCLFFKYVTGHRGRQKSCQLKWGDISMGQDEHGRYLNFKERTTKTRQEENCDARDAPPKGHESKKNKECCPVELYELYKTCRLSQMLDTDSPLYLAVNHMTPNLTNKKSWYKNSALGKNTLGKMMKAIGEGNRTWRKILQSLCSQNFFDKSTTSWGSTYAYKIY